MSDEFAVRAILTIGGVLILASQIIGMAAK